MRFLYFLIIAALVQSIYILGFDKIVTELFVNNGWITVPMIILFIVYFILSLNPANYGRYREQQFMKDAEYELSNEGMAKRFEEINQGIDKDKLDAKYTVAKAKAKRKGKGKTIKSTFTKSK